jgi:hypothetical protein
MNIISDIASNNYSNKYCISSFITMFSYYNSDVQQWSHDELICLCANDGVYQPFKNIRYEKTGAKNLHNLGF